MISVYYNQKYGFLIVPNAIERFMGCYISIEPTIEIMAEETIDKIGCAIRKGIKIAESSPKVDESQLNNFWKQAQFIIRHFYKINIIFFFRFSRISPSIIPFPSSNF